MFRRLTSALQFTVRDGQSGLMARMRTRRDYRRFNATLKVFPDTDGISPQAKQHLHVLEKDGICVLPDFWSASQCAAARAEVDRVITEYPRYVNDNAKADRRVYGADNASRLIADFAANTVLGEVATAYNREATKTAFTLAARMPCSENNRGSGEGWHRDAFFRQFKAILYLSDVGPRNGPFQLIGGSQRTEQVLSDMKAGRLGYMQNRMTDEEIERILMPDPARLHTYTAKAGTLMLVDTSTIHRGQPILEGVRYALTNYYYPVSRIDEALFDKFHVLPAAA